ncbi:MAG: hypothetical protein QNK25_11015, partial [Desulfobacterales bacterium]|nr:hypothetical protein [Desulfobacterales bacterium]
MHTRISVSTKLTTAFWINIGIIVLCIPLFVETLDYPGMCGLFPRLVLIMIVAVTSLDLFQFLNKKENISEVPEVLVKTDAITPSKNKGKVLFLAISMFAFFALLQLLGVIIGTFSFIFISGWCLGHKKIVFLLVASTI